MWREKKSDGVRCHNKAKKQRNNGLKREKQKQCIRQKNDE